MSRPAQTFTLDLDFKYVSGPASPGTFTLDLQFHYLNPRPTATSTLDLDYAMLPPQSVAFVAQADGSWIDSPSYAWDGTAWFAED